MNAAMSAELAQRPSFPAADIHLLRSRALDNVTHSLFGYALGRFIGARGGAERRAAVWTSVVASNAPDLDAVVGLLADDRKLAYLLHHRGHTHTLLLALPIGLAAAAACVRAFGVRESAARVRVGCAGVLAALLHLGFDALNNYGVHPFWPLDNRWYYGDAVFIIEPLLLAVLAPLLVLRGLTRTGRVLGAVVCAGLLALVWLRPEIALGVAFGTTLTLATALYAQQRIGERAGPTLLLATAIVALFAGTALAARGAFRETLARIAPSERIAQLVTTPSPGNPLCWSALAVSVDAESMYRARFGYVSLWPALSAHESCRFLPRGATTAELTPLPGSAARDGDARFVLGWQAPLAELRTLRATQCKAAAALRFIRAPYWSAATHAQPARLGDLRYDNEPGEGFAELALDGACHDAIPPWVPPLAPVLDE